MTVAPARRYDRSDWASAFVNVEEELTDVALTPVRGSVPVELQGTFYRNGPGRLERDGHRVHHPFDCLLYTSPSPRDYAASRMPSSA